MDNGFDQLDQRIVERLRRDGRQANTEIARALGVSESTVRARIQHLVKTGIIQVSAAVNLSRMGYDVDVIVGVHCDMKYLQDVMSALRDMSEVRYATYVAGQYNLMFGACFRSREDLFSFLTDKLPKVPGILRVQTHHVLHVIKRDYYYWDPSASE